MPKNDRKCGNCRHWSKATGSLGGMCFNFYCSTPYAHCCVDWSKVVNSCCSNCTHWQHSICQLTHDCITMAGYSCPEWEQSAWQAVIDILEECANEEQSSDQCVCQKQSDTHYCSECKHYYEGLCYEHSLWTKTASGLPHRCQKWEKKQVTSKFDTKVNACYRCIFWLRSFDGIEKPCIKKGINSWCPVKTKATDHCDNFIERQTMTVTKKKCEMCCGNCANLEEINGLLKSSEFWCDKVGNYLSNSKRSSFCCNQWETKQKPKCNHSIGIDLELHGVDEFNDGLDAIEKKVTSFADRLGKALQAFNEEFEDE